ncbi:hypothetical protein PVAND_006956 [Polypedilum vanderplanki]|uniref:DDT domain-containing protein n=1 Tax=Polypedilum vanderplanki TaxID=319348 RepID=A0A9J6C5B9_POLVA|nr:hypothetical protein PVAND_006956 [Polypedilum vanderplanki]
MTEVKPEEKTNTSLELEDEENEEEESIYSDPNVAVIVSFLENFGKMVFDPQKPPIMTDLMNWLSNTDEVTPELQDLHVKLLRKLKRSVNVEKWERAIIKLCYFCNCIDDGFEIERYGYLHSSLPVKLRILKNLLEMQFDTNAKFKNLVNAKTGTELRLEPFGRDKDGNVYYCQMDEKANIKVYQENTDEETWSVVATNREELVKLIEELKGNKPIRPFAKDLIDEDSSSNSREAVKTDAVVEQKPAEQEYSIDNSATDEFPLKQTIRLVKKAEPVETEEIKAEPLNEESTPEKGTTQKKRRRK